MYAKLAFNGFHVEWADPLDGESIEVFDQRNLFANGFEAIPTLEEFLKVALYDWGGAIVEIKDRSGNVLYRAP